MAAEGQLAGLVAAIQNYRPGVEAEWAELAQLAAALVAEAAVERSMTLDEVTAGLESGGEDMPNAFRTIPVRPDDLPLIAARCPTTGEFHFQQLLSMVFGLSSAVSLKGLG